jgi:hypothetical protein
MSSKEGRDIFPNIDSSDQDSERRGGSAGSAPLREKLFIMYCSKNDAIANMMELLQKVAA